MSDKVEVDKDKTLEDDAKGDDSKPKSTTKDELTAALDKRVEELRAELEGKYKSEIAGLNRRNTELEKAVKDKDDSKKTLEDRVRSIEDEARRKDQELAKERLVRQLHAEAEKRGLVLDDELPIDRIDLSLDEGIAFLDKRKALYEKRAADVANRLMVENSHKPGSGGTPEESKMPYDPNDLSRGNVENIAKWMAEHPGKGA